jgi:hypothetical protein
MATTSAELPMVTPKGDSCFQVASVKKEPSRIYPKLAGKFLVPSKTGMRTL